MVWKWFVFLNFRDFDEFFKFYFKNIISKSVISYILTIRKLQILNYLIIAVDEQYELYKIILISTSSGIIVYNKFNKEI